MRKIFLMFFAIFASLFASDATTTIVNKGVALPSIVVQDASGVSGEFQSKFFKLMVGDLKVGATFDVSDEYLTSSFDAPASSDLGASGTPQMVVRYALSGDQSSSLSLRVKVLDPKNSNTLFEKDFSLSNGEKYPFLAHEAVAEIVKNLGYSNVDWMKNMILISRYTSAKQSEILVADYTLTYQKVLLSGGFNVFPKWANDSQSAFYYTHYINKNSPAIYRYDMASGSKTEILKGKGMLIASDVSKDGSKLLITNAPKDQPDIFVYSLGSGSMKQVTDFSGIDVNGNFVDGDSRVAFVSDRLGYPNVFVTSVNGGSVEQLVFKGRNNNSISTNGNYIVYSSRENGGFNLYLISTQTDSIRQLTAGGKNMFPRFSSDGGSIVFIKSGNAVGIIRVNENKSFQFPLKIGKIQSIDW